MQEQAWTYEGTYTVHLAHVIGREAIVRHIGEFHRQEPGVRIVRASGIDQHHRLLRFGWTVFGAPEPPLAGLEATDFGALAEDGRLRRIVAFCGPLPCLDQGEAAG